MVPLAETHEARQGSRASGSSAAPSGKLKPGPGRSAQEVSRSQRVRIQGAMVELAAERGYESVTVRGLSRRAGVSSGTLYDHFAGKEDCFFHTYELLMARFARRMVTACEKERDWRRRIRLAFSTFVRQVADEPQISRVCFVEALAVGPSALERTRPAAEMFAGIVKSCFAEANEVVVPPLLVKGIVAGLAAVARARLLTGQESELPKLGEELAEWGLCFGIEAIAELSALGPTPVSAPKIELAVADGIAWRNEQPPRDDRSLIVSATARLAASEGYRELSIPRIRAAAGVSRGSFDAHFENIDDCFLAALELWAKSALGEATRQGTSSRSWAESVQRTISALCTQIVGDPLRARTVFVEIFAPGTDGVRHRAKLIDDIAGFVRSTAPRGQRPGKLAAEASVGAIWGILEYHVASGRTRRLPSMAPILAILVLAPSIGTRQAVEAIARRSGEPDPHQATVAAQ